MNSGKPRVALFLPTLRGGGAERVLLTLAHGFAERGLAVDLVLPRAEGVYLTQVAAGVRVIDLGARSVLPSLPALTRYLRRERPTALLSTLWHANIVAVFARRLARVRTRVILREANTPSRITQALPRLTRVGMPLLIRWFYRWADEVVAVSEGVAKDLELTAKLPRARIHVLPNPVLTPDLPRLAAEPLDDPWFALGEPPVILGVGRLELQKDFPTLIRAFAAVRAQRPVRLVILGEGKERDHLESLLDGLQVREDARLPGFVANPFVYMARAGVFVLSSAWEGMPGVLIQALASGAPVVATDCESGPREVLHNGRFGRLVPVGDANSLAEAISDTLDGPRCPLPDEVLRPFAQSAAVKGYLRLFRITPSV